MGDQAAAKKITISSVPSREVHKELAMC